MSDRENDIERLPETPTHDAASDTDNDRAGAGGAAEDSAGMPGGTLGTGGAREQDQ